MRRIRPVTKMCAEAVADREDLQLFNQNQHVMKVSGGWGGIRTHGRLAPTAVFKTAALNHSATHPTPARLRHLSQHAKPGKGQHPPYT